MALFSEHLLRSHCTLFFLISMLGMLLSQTTTCPEAIGLSFLSSLMSISNFSFSLRLSRLVLTATFWGKGFIHMLQSESPSFKHVEEPEWMHQPGSSLQAVSFCLVLEQCWALFLLGFTSFCPSNDCLDLWLYLHSKIAEPALIIPP